MLHAKLCPYVNIRCACRRCTDIEAAAQILSADPYHLHIDIERKCGLSRRNLAKRYRHLDTLRPCIAPMVIRQTAVDDVIQSVGEKAGTKVKGETSNTFAATAQVPPQYARLAQSIEIRPECTGSVDKLWNLVSLNDLVQIAEALFGGGNGDVFVEEFGKALWPSASPAKIIKAI